MSENSQDCGQKPKRNCAFMNSYCIVVMQLFGFKCQLVTAIDRLLSGETLPLPGPESVETNDGKR